MHQDPWLLCYLRKKDLLLLYFFFEYKIIIYSCVLKACENIAPLCHKSVAAALEFGASVDFILFQHAFMATSLTIFFLLDRKSVV